MRMKVLSTEFEGLHIIEPEVYGDERGYFIETYNQRDLQGQGIDNKFVQDNQSKSKKGVLRGLHFQNAPYAQTKLVRVLSGAILDVAVDLRRHKKTFGKSFGIQLSSENKKQLLIPKGFAHGFIVLSENAEMLYKIDEFHYPESEGGIIYDDPALGIDWMTPAEDIILSARDTKHPLLAEAHFHF
jgi:dTDP-4-dehydrorhamnose 3,5-epimerase